MKLIFLLPLLYIPELWASHDRESAPLYQIVQGEMLLRGSVDNDKAHGAPSTSSGAWYAINAIPENDEVSADSDSLEQSAPWENLAAEESWIELFDGKSFGGWRNYGGQAGDVKKWVINDGMLELVPSEFPLLAMARLFLFGGASGDLIYAEEKFRNFELNLEWKISENGNSGIKYLVVNELPKVPSGLEMQVLHNEGHPDGQNYKHRAGDLYDLVAAAPETVLPPGQWNEARIRFNKGRIQHWLNGSLVVDITRSSAEWNTAMAASKYSDMTGFGMSDEGYIVLQDHGDPVWYRNIRIRRIMD